MVCLIDGHEVDPEDGHIQSQGAEEDLKVLDGGDLTPENVLGDPGALPKPGA